MKPLSTLFVGCSSLILCCALSAPTQADWFDKMDQQFEGTFEKTDAAFERALKDGVAELDKELANIWGESRRLPEAKTWVGYSEDQKTRYIVDYEKGEMTVEGFDQDEKQLSRAFQNILVEDNRALDKRAALKRKFQEKTRPFVRQPRTSRPWTRTQPAPKKDEVPEERVATTQPQPKPTWVQRNELARLIQPASRPTFVKRDTITKGGKKATLARLSIRLRKDRDRLSAESLALPIQQVAQKYNLPHSLILSVIKNESSFNPRARSHANAMGLMQLVATSGGKEAYSYLRGEEATPGPDVLYDPYENIMLGATYLHLLNTRYFGRVKDDQAREYLIIAAYNTGAGNVAKAFTGKMKLKSAIKKINSLNSQQVFEKLQASLPYKETKTYLAKVSRDKKNFTQWDT